MFDPLAAFSPVVSGWFRERHGEPTPVQRDAWPAISRGAHVLATAPTGSGKTLAAFLWALDRLLSGAWAGGAVRIVYVSPLRALANDIRRNLTEPLEALTARFQAGGRAAAPVRVAVRTGDTPASERRRMLRRPPEILVTTPESLNLLLSTPAGVALLSGARTVILDEVHAVASTKRGTHLISAVERLALVAGEIQRVGLSATVRPLERIARWLGGYSLSDGRHERRPVEIIRPPASKAIAVQVSLPEPRAGADACGSPQSRWQELAGLIAERIKHNRSTIVFANGRRLVEKMARFINDAAGGTVVWAHHGSLSRPLRESVEERLKSGRLAGIVATSSLELGIDIGVVDEVVLVGTPPTVASAVQRIGRSGHSVGQTSRGILYPSHARDILLGAVVVRAVLDGEIEETSPPAAPLDVLAQVVLSMVSTGSWQLDRLHEFVRTIEPYHDLSRRQFDLVIEMLAGRYAGTRLTVLGPRVTIDRVDGTLAALPGATRLLWSSGGTIPDRGYLKLRLEGHGGRTGILGELDEEFVWERSEGDSFTLGVQAWRIRRITQDDVYVEPAGAKAGMAPFWRGEERDQSHFLAGRAARLLEELEPRVGDPALSGSLTASHALDLPAAERLCEFLDRQRTAMGGLIPHRHRVVIEQAPDSLTIVHTVWGGRVNRPFAMALAAALSRLGHEASIVHDDMCVMIESEAPIDPIELIGLVRPETLDALLRQRIESTGFFGARFRENAGRALLLPRIRFGRRTPLWRNRERARQLLSAVMAFEDFPIVLETWRTCLVDELEVGALHDRLAEVASGTTAVAHVRTAAPTPFAADALWKRTNHLMYEDDTPERGPSRVSSELVREVARSPGLRPRFAPDTIERLRRKLHRVEEGYAPRPGPELVAWVEDRVALPGPEWKELMEAIRRDHAVEPDRGIAMTSSRLVGLPTGAGEVLICSVPDAAAIADVLGLDSPALLSTDLDGSRAPQAAIDAIEAVREAGDEAEEARLSDLPGLVSAWLRFSGPVSLERLSRIFGLTLDRVEEALDAASPGTIVRDCFTEGSQQDEVCDLENLERLLRLARSEARGRLEPLPADALAPFLARHHGLGGQAPVAPADGPDRVEAVLEHLLGFPVAVSHLETEILPARIPGYRTAWLDALFARSDWAWFGCGERRIAFGAGADRELLAPPVEDRPAADALFPAARGRFTFADLVAHSGLATGELTRRLWEEVWRGHAANDGFEALRKGLESGFAATEATPIRQPHHAPGRRIRQTRLSRWRASRPFPGAWYRLLAPEPSDDPFEMDEIVRDRARVVLARHGVVFRELLARELPSLRWPAIVRALQVLELAGEAVAGRFFAGVTGLQFALPSAVEALSSSLDEDRVFWVCAADPASVAGLSIEGLQVPRRVDTTHTVHHGRRVVVVSTRRGRTLELSVAPDDPALPRYLGFLDVLLTREVSPERAVRVETINAAPAAESPYRRVLEARFAVDPDHRTLWITRRT